MGRPTDLTPELGNQICDYIARGVPKQQAAALAGIDETTLYDWINKGTGDEAKECYAVFAQSVKLAESRFVLLTIDRVEGETDPKMWAKWMTLGERLQPGVFAKVDRVQLTGKDGGPVESVSGIMGVSDAEIERLASGKKRLKST